MRLPFGTKRSYKEEGLRARLDESPERDIDIVSNEAIVDDGVNQQLLNASTGTAQNVIHVNNTAAGGGDGSVETPYDTLAAAEAAAGANDLIYVHRGDGTTTGQDGGITLDEEGQMLVGSGANLNFDSGRYSTSNGSVVSSTTIIKATAAPVITNGAGDGVNITADNALVSGITIDGATAYGVNATNNFGVSWDKGVSIDNVTAQNNTLDGLYVYSTGVGSYIGASWGLIHWV